MTDEKKYKVDTKGKITRMARDLQKVLGVRGSAPAPSPPEGEKGSKKP